MPPNVTGMSQYADGGPMTTKPYTSGGACIPRMSDLCEGCAYRPGDRACLFTTGDRSNLEEVLATDRRWDEEVP